MDFRSEQKATLDEKLRFMIIAGESSGDAHGSALISELKAAAPDCVIYGIGGEKMQAAGIEVLHDITELAVVGLAEVIKNFSRFRRIFYEMLKVAETRKPDAVILIDYPGFNLRFARRARALGLRVIYYISPQVWAWGRNRVRRIKDDVDRMLVIFPFEEQFYRQHGIDARFVGHPMIERLQPATSAEEFRRELGISSEEKVVGLLPGSRENEIRRHLPVMLKAAAIIKKKYGRVRFVIPPASPGLRSIISEIIRKQTHCPPVQLWEAGAYDVMDAADVAMVSSGTATLETGCFGTPLVVIYKVNWLTYLMAKKLIKIPNIGMINIVAEAPVAPELVQRKASAANIAGEALKLLTDDELRLKLSKQLSQVRKKLGSPGASRKAAHEILDFVKCSKAAY